MVWAGVSAKGLTDLIFVDSGVKINQDSYQKEILAKALANQGQDIFGNSLWLFQQDGGPAHQAKTTQAWLRSTEHQFHPEG